MSDHNTTNTTVRDTRVEERRTGSGMAFIVGGLVVAVLIVAWVLYGGLGGDDVDGVGDTTNIAVETPATAPVAGGDTVVVVPETTAAPADAAPADAAPADAAPADAAPAGTAPAATSN